MSDAAPDRSVADDLLTPALNRSLTQLPSLLHQSFLLVWRSARSQLVWTMALQALGGLALGAQLLVARSLLSSLLSAPRHRAFHAALPDVLVLVAILAVSGVVTVLQTEMQRLLAEMVSWRAMQRVVRAATSADLLSFESPAFHDRLQRSIVNASIRPLAMTTGLLTVGSSLISTAAVAVTIAIIEPLFLILALVAVVPITVVTLRVGRALFQFAVEQTPTDRERFYIQQLLTEKDSAKEVRAYALGPYLRSRFDDLYGRRIAALRQLVRNRMTQGIGGSLVAAAISGGVLVLLVLSVSDGRASLAGAGTAAAALLLLGQQLQSLSSGVGQLYESSLFVSDFSDFTGLLSGAPPAGGRADTPPAGGRADTPPAGGRVAAPTAPGKIEVRGLTFTYPSREAPSLIDVDVAIEPGQVVALVGENGSGKTTLAKILAGLYPAGPGVAFWDGIDVATMDLDQMRAQVAVLFQDFVRYFFSARDNVALGRWERSGDAEAVRRALEASGAQRLVDGLPRGLDTLLGPQFFGGSDLSGGQWQRIALARAVFRDARLVILDEPTAALDPRAEAALFESVRQLFAGRSVLLISHRFATVRMADHIYVLSEGRVVEHGTHAQLLAASGLYEELFRLQAAPFAATGSDGDGPQPGVDPIDGLRTDLGD